MTPESRASTEDPFVELRLAYEQAVAGGASPEAALAELRRRFPGRAAQLDEFPSMLCQLGGQRRGERAAPPEPTPTVDPDRTGPYAPFPAPPSEELPAVLGYEVLEVLGRGG